MWNDLAYELFDFETAMDIEYSNTKDLEGEEF